MKIAISTLVTPANKSGVGNYVIHLIDALQEIDRENEYYVFIGRDTKHLFKLRSPNFYPIYLPISHNPRWLMRPLYYLWQNSLIYLHLKQHQIGLLHLPNLLPLLIRFVPTIVTIPDLAEYKVSRYSRIRQVYRKAIPHLVAKRANRIIAISYSARQHIATTTGVSPDRIDVTYLASTISDIAIGTVKPDVVNEYAIKGEYVLYVGSTLPHKNLRRVVEAFALLKRQRQIPHQLVLVSDKDKSAALLAELMSQLTVEDEIVLTGYVPDSDLPTLYQNASLFVFPSLYEGFGLPVLEAMTCGTPVVTSNVSSLPEVAGDAAVLVNPLNVESIADGMWSVLSDENKRERMICLGKKQVRRFTWKACALQTLASYYKALEQS